MSAAVGRAAEDAKRAAADTKRTAVDAKRTARKVKGTAAEAGTTAADAGGDRGKMKTGCERRLDKSFRNAPVIALYPNSKLVLFADCHRGVGNTNDNFLKNQNLYMAALRHYYERGFLYLELGDGDELWENRSFDAIYEIHEDVFSVLSLFEKENRLYMLYGNHDHEMKENRRIPHYAGIIIKLCGCTEDKERTSVSRKTCPAAPCKCGGERAKTPCLELYLTHGNQADFLNSTLWKLSRFLVRYVWKPLEQIGVLDPTSAAKNYQCRSRSEKRLSSWAVKHQCYLIAGHTHRPVLGDSSTRYFNTGSCVHPGSITCLEIENCEISLVKWRVEVRKDNTLFVVRECIAGPLPLREL